VTTESRRSRRVAELLRSHLGSMMIRELGDPRLSSLVITTVEVSEDLSQARIGVRLLVDDNDPEVRRGVLRALRGASGRLRHSLAPAMRVRRLPELRFVYDTGPDAARRVEELLAEIARDPKASD